MKDLSREYQFSHPSGLTGELQKLSGLELLQKMMAGELPPPPIADTLDFTLESAEEGRVVFTVTPQVFHYNPLGTVHGGLLATLLDSAMACAVHSQLAAGITYTTLELKVNYLRPLTERSGKVTCVGETLYLGARQATAEGKVYNARQELVAHATTTCMLFRP